MFVDCTNPVLALILLFLYGIVYAGFIPGVWTALLCIAPNYSGTLASVFYFITNISKILASTIVGLINKTVFFIKCFSIYVVPDPEFHLILNRVPDPESDLQITFY